MHLVARARSRKARGSPGSSRLSTALREALRKCANSCAKLVHLLVVEADVGQHGDLGPVERDRAVALVDLADEQLGIADQSARERRRGRHEILHHRAVHHRRLAVAGVEDPADHPGHGRLAAGPADGDAALRSVEQPGEELRAGEVGEAELAWRGRRRGQSSSTAAEVTSVMPWLQARPVLREQLDPERAQIVELVRRPPGVERAVGARDLGARRRGRCTPAEASRCRRCR